MLQVYSKMRIIFEFTPASLPNHSNPPWNQLAVYAEGPGQFVYKIASEDGSTLVREDVTAAVRTEGSGIGALGVSEQTKGSGFYRLVAAQGLHACG